MSDNNGRNDLTAMRLLVEAIEQQAASYLSDWQVTSMAVGMRLCQGVIGVTLSVPTETAEGLRHANVRRDVSVADVRMGHFGAATNYARLLLSALQRHIEEVSSGA